MTGNVGTLIGNGPSTYGQSAYQGLADQYADKYGVPRSVFSAVINQESGWNPFAFGTSGEVGLTQLMPATASNLGVTNPWDVNQNLQGGASFLSTLFAKYKDWTKTLAAYNAGDPTSAAGLNYAKAVLGQVGPVADAGAQGTVAPGATPAPGPGHDSFGDYLHYFLDSLGIGANSQATLAAENAAAGNDPNADAGGWAGLLPKLIGDGQTVGKYAIVGFVALAALGLGLWALTRSATNTALPIARSAVR